MGVWPAQAPDQTMDVTVRFEKGVAVAIDGVEKSPLDLMLKANALGGAHGVGLKNALENRIIGTKSRGVYESPGMELLGICLKSLYQAVLDRRSAALFEGLSRLIADQVYDGRMYDPSTRAAMAAIDVLAAPATGSVTVGLYKGNVFFQSLTDCLASLYREEDSSMEASDGLNPVSSQGFAEIQSVEAKALALAGQVG